ncbi:GDSL esterase/lipase At1g29670-like [Nymphaea colorata]|nr:GDSL esterase/lipase At1g29670-like [Nymphaea colorata]
MQRPGQPLPANMLHILFLVFFPFSHLLVAMAESNVTAMFVFGDSIVDSGNNDFLDTTSKGNYYPYGVDFPAGATGRFTNGRNPADILAQLLGLPRLLPVFNDPLTKGSAILSGVNYATGGSGILVSTSVTANVTSLGQQVTNFINSTLPDLESQLKGSAGLSSYLSQSIFLFNSGGDDLSVQCSASALAECFTLAEELVGNFTQQLERLYDYGARKFVVFNLMPSGCDVYAKSINNGTCAEYLNEADLYFNHKLKAALDGVSKEKVGMAFVYVNITHMVNAIFDDPAAYGVAVTNESCCTVPSDGAGFLCSEGVAPCSDRSSYLYFDTVHPTEHVYVQLSTKAYSSELDTEVYPFNVKVLAGLAVTSSLAQPWGDA